MLKWHTSVHLCRMKCCLRSWSWQSIIQAHGRLFRNVPTRTCDSFSILMSQLERATRFQTFPFKNCLICANTEGFIQCLISARSLVITIIIIIDKIWSQQVRLVNPWLNQHPLRQNRKTQSQNLSTCPSSCLQFLPHFKNPNQTLRYYAGLDIGYVPAGPHAFLRLSGQFGPLQLIFHWPEGPVDFFFFFFFF